MKLGIGLGYWGLEIHKREQRELALAGERLGYDSLWIAEGYGSDAVSVMAWLATLTERIGIGSAVMQIPARTAAMTAMSAATLDQISDGRFVLGLGPSGAQVSEGWHGVAFNPMLTRTREYVEVVRMALRRERLAYAGETIQLPLPGGPGKSLKLTIEPHQPAIPIYLAGLGVKSVALIGEIADGWIPTFFSPEHVAALTEPLREGAAKAGRDPSEIAIVPQVTMCVDEDRERARDAMRWKLALYIGGMGSRTKNVYAQLMARYGYAAEAAKVQDLYLSGCKEEAAAAIPGELIDLVSICGPEDAVAERLRAYADAGTQTLILIPSPGGNLSMVEQLEVIARIRSSVLV